MIHFLYFLLFNLCVLFMLATTPGEAALTVDDCPKCHQPEYQQIRSAGRAHKEQVTCQDCHKSHRPLTANNIPACQNCHEPQPHEQMTDCSSCHPIKENCLACHQVHQPLARTDTETPLLHCKACHPRAVTLLTASTSKHHKLSCGFCHPLHRKIQGCRVCHGTPHPAGTHSLFPQCTSCHNVAHDLNPL